MASLPDAVLLGSLIIAGALVLSAWLLRGRAGAAPGSGFIVPAAGANVPLPAEALPVQPSGIPVSPSTPLRKGTRVLVNWQGSWWRGEVLDVESDDRVRIHYVGWDSSWDETVPRGSLQVDPSESVR